MLKQSLNPPFSMRKLLLSTLFSIVMWATNAQENFNGNPTSSFIFQFGRNIHGTGDMPGYSYGLSYDRNFESNWFLNFGFEGSLNDERDQEFIWEDPDGNSYNSTLHSVTAGFQLNIGGGYNFINKRNHRIGLNPQIFGRYQATSMNDVEIIQYPALTGLPVPIRFIYNDEPSRTLAVGGALKIFYDYKFNNGYSLGILSGFQIDSNGDTMRYALFRIGKLF